MNMKKLSKGGNLQYIAVLIILCIFLIVIVLENKLPSIEFIVVMIGLMVVNILLGIGFDIREKE